MKRLLGLVSLVLLLILGWQSVAAAAPSHEATDAPTITSFTTPSTKVTRAGLTDRTARVPVSWTTQNRPLVANLFFEQVLPDGSVVNVELPRLIPWVNSNGDGIAAPILPSPGASKITLRVRLASLLTGHVFDERMLELPIVDENENGSPIGVRPRLVRFDTPSTYVRPDDLNLRTARIPVNWDTRDRQPTMNLVFEQVLSNGTVVNVELPRENPWVASSGSGVAAPMMPGGDADRIRLRVRLIDLLTGRVYDQREIELPIADDPDAAIAYFTTSASEVAASALAQQAARVPVSWRVDNRPANTNLVFEQVLPDGTVLNVELPRQNPYVASQGDGVVAPVLPTSGNSVRLRVRLVNLTNNETLHSRELNLPVTGQAGQPTWEEVVNGGACLNSPAGPQTQMSVGAEGRGASGIPANGIAITSAERNGSEVGRLHAGEAFTVLEGPYCWRYLWASNSAQLFFRLWKIRTANNIEGWVQEFKTQFGQQTLYLERADEDNSSNPPAETEIVTFALDRATASAGDTVTVNWDVRNATSVTLRGALTSANATDVLVEGLPPTGSTTFTVPENVPVSTTGTLYLYAYNQANAPAADEVSTTITFVCPEGTTVDENGQCAPPANEPPADNISGDLSISPVVQNDGGWLTLPTGETVTVSLVNAVLDGVTQVNFYVTPTGTNVADLRELIGSDTNLADGAAVSWQVPAGLSSHVSAVGLTTDGREVQIGLLIPVTSG